MTDALSAELPKLAPQQAVGLLSVLADRNDGGLPPAVLNAAKSGDKQLRIAAIGVVGRLGDATSVPTLLEIAADSDEELAQAAASALATMPGDNVNSELVASIFEGRRQSACRLDPSCRRQANRCHARSS